MVGSVAVQTLLLKYPFRISRGSSTFRRTVRLRLQADGVVGWGEGSPNPRYNESVEGAATVLDRLLQLPELELNDDIGALIDAASEVAGDCRSALQAFDLAVHDWYGRKTGIPLHQLWDVDPHTMPPSSWTIGIDEPEVMARRAVEAAEFEILKIKVGTADDRAIIESIRSVTARPLRIDANEGWADRETAIREIEWLAGRNVEFVEQPLPADRFEDLVWLKERSPLPLIADESACSLGDLEGLSAAFHGVNVKLSKCGGLRAALQLFQEARRQGMSVMIGCMVESSCALAAAAQIAPLADYVDLDSNLLVVNDPFDGQPMKRGRIELNRRPGLGVVYRERDSRESSKSEVQSFKVE
jgi:L-Ala-D/L-Glu epimerase